MDEIIKIIPLLIPIFLIQFSLQVYSIINLVRRNKVRYNNKLLWGVVIIVGGFIGPIVYLVLRGDDE